MTHFFFHIRDNRQFIEDTEGVDLPDIVRAIEEAEIVARELVAEMVLKGEPIDGQVFEITNEMGVIVHRVYWRDAVKFDD